MQFTVPQFIYREAKILGPLTFRQMVYIGAGGGVCFFVYLILGKKSMISFIALSFLIMTASAILAFGQFGGKSIPTMVSNFFTFSFSSKLYRWYRKPITQRIVMTKIVQKVPKKSEEGAPLKIAEKSRLRDLTNDIETK